MPNTLTMAGANHKSTSTLFLQTSFDMTLGNFSPCNNPSCEHCQLSPSVKNSSSVSLRPTTSRTSASPSAEAVLASMDMPEPPIDNESSALVHEMMLAARARAGFVPGASTSKTETQLPLPLTAGQQDFDDSVEAAVTRSSALIAKVQAQLAAPKIAPAELTGEEKQEVRRNRALDLQHRLKMKAIDRALKRNETLFENAKAAIDASAQKRGSLPDCDNLLSWDSNVNSTGTPFRSGPRTEACWTADRTADEATYIPDGQSLAWQNVWQWEYSYSW